MGTNWCTNHSAWFGMHVSVTAGVSLLAEDLNIPLAMTTASEYVGNVGAIYAM